MTKPTCAACRGRHLKLAHVSPRLAALANTGVPMPATTPAPGWAHAPAAAGPEGDGITIAALESRVEILGTKTRPKRLWLLGSDGRSRSFLVKVGAGCMRSASCQALCLLSALASPALKVFLSSGTVLTGCCWDLFILKEASMMLACQLPGHKHAGPHCIELACILTHAICWRSLLAGP